MHSFLPKKEGVHETRVSSPAQAASLIEQMRAAEASLIYDPATKTLRTDTEDAVPISVG